MADDVQDNAPSPTPPPPAAEMPREKITYDDLWAFCAALETDRARWATTLNDKPSAHIERERQICIRLCNMVKLFELYESEFMRIVKYGGSRRREG